MPGIAQDFFVAQGHPCRSGFACWHCHCILAPGRPIDGNAVNRPPEIALAAYRQRDAGDFGISKMQRLEAQIQVACDLDPPFQGRQKLATRRREEHSCVYFR